MKKRGFTIIELLIVIVFLLAAVGGVGWCMNLYKLCHYDFNQPLKAEVIRGVCVVIPPAGMIAGFMTINDGVSDSNNVL